MSVEIGHIEAIFRYPVKSMRGESLAAATLGWHGVEGDRRFALRRNDARGGMPWLTATRLPDLLAFTPLYAQGAEPNAPPTHVRTPEGEVLPLFGEALAADIGRRHGAPVHMLHLRHGIFDDASISVISSGTIHEIGQLAGRSLHVRRFRPNILVRSTRAVPFEEDAWLGCVLSFGDAPEPPAVSITTRDERCAMLNFDPEEPRPAPEVLKAVVRSNENYAGVYATVIRTGELRTGQRILLHSPR